MLTKKEIGQKIKAQRKRVNMSQATLAEKIEVNPKQISRLESGVNYPSLKHLLLIIEALDMKLSDFDPKKETLPIMDDISHILNNATEKELTLFYGLLKTVVENR